MRVTDKQKTIVTELIDKALADNVMPWHSPYLLNSVLPYNASTGKKYKGVNLFSLLYADSPSKAFLTFKQANEAGLKINKGAKGYPIAFYTQLNVEDKDTGDNKFIPCLKTYIVFRLEDCSGSRDKLKLVEHVKQVKECDSQNAEIDAQLKPYIDTLAGGLVSENQAVASYNPYFDSVNMPQFQNMVSGTYYSTLCHELIHSTGHDTRLKRKLSGFKCNKTNYSTEELIAEIGSVLLCLELGIKPDIDNSASYLKSWSKFLAGDAMKLYSAASKADKAVDFIVTSGRIQ